MRPFSHDLTLALLREGYALLPNRRRDIGGADFRMRILGRPAVCVCGPEATRRFYDDALFVRNGALPGPVQRTLTGVGAVHTLDDTPHTQRKGMFMTLEDPVAVRASSTGPSRSGTQRSGGGPSETRSCCSTRLRRC